MTDRGPMEPVTEWLVRLATRDVLSATISCGDLSLDSGGVLPPGVVLGALADAQEAEGRALWEDT